MKISKLFHWLYASVMLLPIFAIGVTCLVNTFNNQAKEQTELLYKYETNEVNTLNDIQYGRIYHVTINSAPTNTTYIDFATAIAIYNLPTYSGNYDVDAESNQLTYLRLRYNNNQFLVSSDSYANVTVGTQWNTITFPFEFDYVARSTLEEYDLTYVETSASQYNLITGTTEKDLDNIFYNAVDKVTESPLFSWAYNSFLVAPFSYIVALFGMPTNHVVVQLLSYWLAISIIWLVFDLVMYVPLLVHRWLDKGVLE